MALNIADYLDEVSFKYLTGHATEHSYRPALEALFRSIDPALTVINEPKKSEAGMPDFLFQRNGVPFGWAEAKDIDKDVIRLKGYSIEQRKRYEKAYPNLIYTNGVDFEFIREGERVHYVSIADFLMGLQPRPERFEEFERQLRLFAEQKPISIRSAAKLAEMMAAKAAIIKDEIGIALGEDPQFRSGLGGQYKSFKANLLPALEPDEFADIYAETITYGMFAARFHDDDLSTFSRQEALEKLPASNPFLKGLFEYIAGPQLPKRLTYIVDDLVHLMRASDPHSLFRDFGKFTARNDPFVHFYEDFLAAYNPKKRKSRGVWYTPEPVVDFIVRAVDDVLKHEFHLPDGLADTSKVIVDWDTGRDHPKTGKPITERREVHKVQILDPATGTGTFLAKVVQLISTRVKAKAPGKWSSYVEQDLLPRLHGFELLMASYAMCHMKLDMMLDQTGYKPSAKPPRLSVWLTNSLEPADREVRDLFFQPLAEEARGASKVKRQTPVMCVIGNPPYSGESANKGAHIMDLMEAYKKEPGGKQRLKERNPKWINDDYVKFIRMSEDLIASNSSGGVLGFITNHSYLDNPTFRGMRWHLLETFDKIWVIDLHGNSKKKETAPDGSADVNVFDIMQGVALIIAVRTGGGTADLAEVWHGDLWGSRKIKNQALWANKRRKLAATELPRKPPSYPLVPRDYELEESYQEGFSLVELMPRNQIGFQSHRDNFAVAFERQEIEKRLAHLRNPSLSENDLAEEYDFQLSPHWDLAGYRRDPTRKNEVASRLSECDYRPLDRRWCLLDEMAMDRPRWPLMRASATGQSFALNVVRQTKMSQWRHAVVSEFPAPAVFVEIKDGSNFVPLYAIEQIDGSVRLNFDAKLYAAICKAAGIDPANHAGPEHDFRSPTGDARPSEVKVFDYIYGVLHSPTYREKFAEFLKIDFPRIPYPPSPEVFGHLSEKGEQLRRLHLMEEAAIGEAPYTYLGDGDDVVAAGYPKFEDGKVYVNKDQHFADVPAVTWTFHIGGYQPAQKWLKDRRGRSLSWDDIGHYQKIVKILVETDRIMKEIELPLAGTE
ncbi:MAG TPA: type ISP restriction/modification enzyme [Allosphingosinicella sp.]|nr:type ISP restriction/modification enzyme [Allosphingosinicella sp.]